MKFIKTVAVLLAVSVSLMVPSFAWDSDSFVGQDFYFYEPVINYAAQSPSLMADVDSSSDTSLSGIEFLNLWSLSSTIYGGCFNLYIPSQTIAGVYIPATWANRQYPDSVSSFVSGFDSSSFYLNGPSFTMPTLEDFSGLYPTDPVEGYLLSSLNSSNSNPSGSSWVQSFDVDVDLTSFGSFTTFELSGTVHPYYRLYYSSSSVSFWGCNVSLFVNGSLVKVFYPSSSGYIDFSSFIYNSSVPITSISFSFSFPENSIDFTQYSGSLSYQRFGIYAYAGSASPVTFTVLSGDDVLNGQAGSTQDDVNEIEGIESQWGNSMTENFNALSLDTFTYPDGLTSGFSLISGIFQDLWNAMGSYSILYVLPLTLAVVLLLIGRISKFAGQGRSSPSKEE